MSDRTGEECPSCHKGKLTPTGQKGWDATDQKRVIVSAGYVCDYCGTTHAMFHGTVAISASLSKIKVKDQNHHLTVKSTFTKNVEKRISTKPSDAIQIVRRKSDRKILHIHCKAQGCLNEWKSNEEFGYESKFSVKETKSSPSEIKCLKCGRVYQEG